MKKAKHKKGQAVVEYILMMALMVALLAGIFWPQIIRFAQSVSTLRERYARVISQRQMGIPLSWFGGNPNDFNFADQYQQNSNNPAVGGGGIGANGTDPGQADSAGDDVASPDTPGGAADVGAQGADSGDAGNGPDGGGGRGRRGGGGGPDSANGGTGTDGDSSNLTNRGGRGGRGAGEGGDDAEGEDGGTTRQRRQNRPNVSNEESRADIENQSAEVNGGAGASEEKKENDAEGVKGDPNFNVASSKQRREDGCQEINFWGFLKIALLIGIIILVAVIFFSAISKSDK